MPGRRTVKVRMINTYLPALYAAASTGSSLARAIVRVMGMVDQPAGLLRPDRLLRVLWHICGTYRHGQRTAPKGRRTRAGCASAQDQSVWI
jgi:hypothetical protein